MLVKQSRRGELRGLKVRLDCQIKEARRSLHYDRVGFRRFGQAPRCIEMCCSTYDFVKQLMETLTDIQWRPLSRWCWRAHNWEPPASKSPLFKNQVKLAALGSVRRVGHSEPNGVSLELPQ